MITPWASPLRSTPALWVLSCGPQLSPDDVALTLTSGHALRVPVTGLPPTPAPGPTRSPDSSFMTPGGGRVNGLARRLCLYEAMRFVIAGAGAVGGFVAATQ